MTKVDTFIVTDYLEVLVPSGNKDGKFICPNCGANDFSVASDGKKFKCFSGCDDNDAIVIALKKKKGTYTMNLTTQTKPEQEFYSYSSTQRIKRYYVTDKDGQWKKSFCYEHFKDGYWKKGKGEEKWHPYKIDNAKTILRCKDFGFITLVEGEKCTDAVDELPLPVFTFGGKDWGEKVIKDAIREHLKPLGVPLVMIPDLDPEGIKKAQLVEKCCNEEGLQFYVLDLDSLWENRVGKQDIYDFLEDKKTLTLPMTTIQEQLVAAIRDAIAKKQLTNCLLKSGGTSLPSATGKIPFRNHPQLKPFISLLSNEDIVVGSWIVEGLIASNEFYLLGGEEKANKSSLVTDLVYACITNGTFANQQVTFPDKKIGWICPDETLKDLKVRTLNRGFNESIVNDKLFYLDEFSLTKEYLDWLENTIVEENLGLVIIDSLIKIIGETEININSTEVTPFIDRLNAMSVKTNCCIFLITHTNKSLERRGAIRAIKGSQSIVSSVSNVWVLLFKCPNNVTNPERELHIVSRGSRPVIHTLRVEEDTEKWINQIIHWEDRVVEPLEAEETKLTQVQQVLEFLHANRGKAFTKKELEDYFPHIKDMKGVIKRLGTKIAREKKDGVTGYLTPDLSPALPPVVPHAVPIENKGIQPNQDEVVPDRGGSCPPEEKIATPPSGDKLPPETLEPSKINGDKAGDKQGTDRGKVGDSLENQGGQPFPPSAPAIPDSNPDDLSITGEEMLPDNNSDTILPLESTENQFPTNESLSQEQEPIIEYFPIEAKVKLPNQTVGKILSFSPDTEKYSVGWITDDRKFEKGEFFPEHLTLIED